MIRPAHIAAATVLLAPMPMLANAAETSLDVVEALSAEMTAGDIAAIEGMFTEDAGYAYSLDGDLRRGDSFDRWLGSDITGPQSVFEIETVSVEGDRVDALVLWGRGGDASSPVRYVFTVMDGRIDSWRIVNR